MHSWVQFITTPTSDTPGTALILHFDNRRYLLGNVHEGTQRACIERGTKLLKISDVFLTGKTEWKNTGGLIGLMLTLADSATSSVEATADAANAKAWRRKNRLGEEIKAGFGNDPKKVEKGTLTIHGGINLTHTLATARRFVFRHGMPIEVDEVVASTKDRNWEPTWSDSNIKVWALPVSPSQANPHNAVAASNSLRKRSFDEYKDGIAAQLDSTSNEIDSAMPDTDIDKHHQIRKAVVGHMFNSDWRLDALVKTRLSEVKMPARLFVRDSVTNKLEDYTGPLPGSSEADPDALVWVRKPWPGALVEKLPPTKPSETAISYIVRNHPQRGKFIPKNALELGVEPGPLFAQLAAGKSVRAKDGKLVTPEQVMSEGKEGNGLAIVDLPDKSYVQPLLSRSEWAVPEIMRGIGCVIWILGAGVIEDDNLRQFLAINSHMKHIISSPDCSPNYLSLDRSAAAAIRLHQVDPERYPIPIHDNVTLPQHGSRGSNISPLTQSIPAKRGLMVQLEPFIGIKDGDVVPPLNTAEVLESTPKDVIELARFAHEELSSSDSKVETENEQLPSPNAEIIFLGTGSATPSKYRNVSATLVRVPGSGSYLMDCGEGTLGQLKRLYTPQKLVEVFKDLKMIWISHLHADHHLGTTSVIKAWYETVHGAGHIPPSINNQAEATSSRAIDHGKILRDGNRLFVVSNSHMIKWLKEYASVEDFGYDKLNALSSYGIKASDVRSTKLWWEHLPVGFHGQSPELKSALQKAMGITELATANVDHCHGAQAISLTFRDGFKFSYSGDCRPSRPFVEIGQGSTVLVHEATFDDELGKDAKAKKHSTTSEAIGVGFAMGAKRVLLTHFSQRYQNIPMMGDVEDMDVKLEGDDATDDDSMMAMDKAEHIEGLSMADAIENDAALDELLDYKKPSRPEDETKSSDVATGFPTKTSDSIIRYHVSDGTSSIRRQDMKIGVGFDYMRVKVKDIYKLEKFAPALVKLFEKGDAIDGVKDVENVVGEGELQADRPKDQKHKKKAKKSVEARGGRMGREQLTNEQKQQMRKGMNLSE